MKSRFEEIFMESEKQIMDLRRECFGNPLYGNTEEEKSALLQELADKTKAIREVALRETEKYIGDLEKEELIRLVAMFGGQMYRAQLDLDAAKERFRGQKANDQIARELFRRRLDRAMEGEERVRLKLNRVTDYADKAKRARRKGALVRHAENLAMKQEAFIWLDSNMPLFKSMDSAAEHLARTVVPVKFRTARDWVGQWKKIRSASKA